MHRVLLVQPGRGLVILSRTLANPMRAGSCSLHLPAAPDGVLLERQVANVKP